MTVLRQFYRQSVVRECPVRYNGATNRTAGSQGGQNDVRTEQDRFWEFSGTAAQGKGHDPDGVSVVLGLVETAAVWAVGLAGTEGAMMLLIINVIFGIVYGAYTLFWMPETLPRYYDENHVCNFAQGAFHMHIPGVYYNNRNWLHVLKAMRVWCVVSMLLTPLCTAAAVVFEQATGWQVWRAVLIGYIASLFGAIVIPAKKYQ